MTHYPGLFTYENGIAYRIVTDTQQEIRLPHRMTEEEFLRDWVTPVENWKRGPRNLTVIQIEGNTGVVDFPAMVVVRGENEAEIKAAMKEALMNILGVSNVMLGVWPMGERGESYFGANFNTLCRDMFDRVYREYVERV